MQVNVPRRTLEVSGFESKSSEFRIEQNSRAFEILSSNIYSDKILAIVRELGCNALDAHIAAGKVDVPIEVHMPNHFEPWFSIKDFGIGLDHEDVMGLYTTYFRSTKATSNEMIGCMGLGSKSPFCYVDQFTVQSRYNGKLRTYNCFVSPEGAPAIQPMSEQNTDEPNGLMVQMPVQPEDFSTFADRAQKIFHRFPTLPTITGTANVDLTKVEYYLEGPNYKIRKEDERYFYSGRSGAYAIQGHVAYPIDYTKIKDIPNHLMQMVNHLPVDIIFPLGELNISASREHLSYDGNTQKNLKARLEQVYKHIPEHFTQVLKDCKTLWEAKSMREQWVGERHKHGRFVGDLVAENLQWNGQKIKDSWFDLKLYDVVPTNNPDPLKPKTMQVDYGVLYTIGSTALQSNPPRGYATPSKLNYGPHNSHKVQAGSNVRIVLDDDMKKSRFVFRFLKHNFVDQDVTVYMLRLHDNNDLPKVLKQLGDFAKENLIKVSDLDDLPKVSRASNQPKIVRKVHEVNYFRNGSRDSFKETTKDVTEGGVFVYTHDLRFVQPFKEPDVMNVGGDIDDFLTTLKSLELLNDDDGEKLTIYAFNATNSSIPKKYPEWTNLFDLVKPKIAEILKQKEELAIMARVYNLAKMGASGDRKKDAGGSGSSYYRRTNIYEELFSDGWADNASVWTASLSDKSPFKKALLTFSAEVKVAKKFLNMEGSGYHRSDHFEEAEKFFCDKVQLLGLKPFDATGAIKKNPDLEQSLQTRYPLLLQMLRNFSGQPKRSDDREKFSRNDILNYVRMVDEHPKSALLTNLV